MAKIPASSTQSVSDNEFASESLKTGANPIEPERHVSSDSEDYGDFALSANAQDLSDSEGSVDVDALLDVGDGTTQVRKPDPHDDSQRPVPFLGIFGLCMPSNVRGVKLRFIGTFAVSNYVL